MTGSSKPTQVAHVLGKNNWTVQNDSSECSDDGQCVGMEERCDRKMDCRDESDETGCKLSWLKRNYNREVPPSSPLSPIFNVSISMVLLKVYDINIEKGAIDLQFEITLEWIDSRITYYNLKNDIYLNSLKNQEIRSIWLPLVIYANTNQKETTRLGENWEWSTSVTVIRKGGFTRNGLEELDETEIFKGEENVLRMVQVYAHQFQCSYDLSNYPFDTQVTQYMVSTP